MASYKRTNPGDAANIFVRCLLCDISTLFGIFTVEDLEHTVQYFDYKCPYTGQDIREKYENSNFALDHIIPHNRASCGLHLYGNLVVTSKEVNSNKASKDYEDFIRNETEGSPAEKQARIDKIRCFIEESGYRAINSHIDEMKAFAQSKYDEIKAMLTSAHQELAGIIGIEVPQVERTRRQSYNACTLERDFSEWLMDKVNVKTLKNYNSALRRILEDAEISFDEFAISIDEHVLNRYKSGGEKSELGDKYGGSGIAVLKKLNSFMAEREDQ